MAIDLVARIEQMRRIKLYRFIIGFFYRMAIGCFDLKGLTVFPLLPARQTRVDSFSSCSVPHNQIVICSSTFSFSTAADALLRWASKEREKERRVDIFRGERKKIFKVKVKEMNKKKSLWLLPAVGSVYIVPFFLLPPLYFRPLFPIFVTFFTRSLE